MRLIDAPISERNAGIIEVLITYVVLQRYDLASTRRNNNTMRPTGNSGTASRELLCVDYTPFCCGMK